MHVTYFKGTFVLEYKICNERVAEKESDHQKTGLEHLLDTVIGLFNIISSIIARRWGA